MGGTDLESFGRKRTVRKGKMRNKTAGFTLIELLVVLVLGSIMLTLGASGFGDTRDSLAVREARYVFSAMAARTRAHAIETGSTAILVADIRGDSVMIFKEGNLIENVRFSEEMGIDIKGESPITRLCMNARGFADTGCNSFNSTVALGFASGTRTGTLKILPLGQIL
jgi:prepilin-type N-terminal cleavage/methylation domain-containing protein